MNKHISRWTVAEFVTFAREQAGLECVNAGAELAYELAGGCERHGYMGDAKATIRRLPFDEKAGRVAVMRVLRAAADEKGIVDVKQLRWPMLAVQSSFTGVATREL